MLRSRALRRVALVGGCLVVLLVLLLVGALGGWLVPVAVAGVGVAGCEVALHRVLTGALPRQLDLVLGELWARLPLEQALLLVYVVREPRLGDTAQDVVVGAVVAYQLLRLAHSAAGLAAGRLAVPRALVRDTNHPHRPGPSLTPLTGARAREVLVAATGLPAVGLLWAAAGGSFALVAPAAAAMVAVAAAVVAAGGPTLLRLVRRPRGAAAVRAAHEAVLRHRPEVVVYSAGRAEHLHWVTPWLDTLDELGARGRPAVVMIRDPAVLDLLPPASTPVVCLPDPRDIIPFTLPDARVALYVSTNAENLRLLRSPDLRSALIGHGESDKSAGARPTAKMFDEVWVPGEAGRDRYLRADVGVRSEQIRIVGRPQVRRIRPAGPRDPGAPFSVLYAPTWEGLDDEVVGSSLLSSGLPLVRQLLATEGVRVLYRPHLLSGRRDPRVGRVSEQIIATLAQAGPPHAVLQSPATEIDEALNAADVLITDVSSVIADFLASGKPYVVVNDTDLGDAQFRERFPSTAGALLIGAGAEGLAAALADARGPDTMRAARDRVRLALIGPPTDDPVGVFAAAIDALGDTLRPRATTDTGADSRAYSRAGGGPVRTGAAGGG